MQLRQSVADFVVEIEGKFGQNLKEGRNARITFMAHLWEPLRCALWLYLKNKPSDSSTVRLAGIHMH